MSVRPAPPAAIAWISLAVLLAAGGTLAACGSSGTEPSDPCADPGSVCTIAGGSTSGFNGDGKGALDTWLYYPIDLTFDPAGRLVIIDWNNHRVRRLETDGTFRTILGTGYEAEFVEGGLAVDTPIHHPFSFDYDAGGVLYLAGFHVANVFKVGLDDRVYGVAGDGFFGSTGDGGPAIDARLESPCGVAVAPGGFPIFISDTFNHRIRVVSADGVIRPFAGTGTAGYSGDGGPATEAELYEPYRVRYDAATGNLYVCDTKNHVVRRVDPSGTITTVVGTSTGGVNGDDGGFGGDGGPAAQARLTTPYDAIVGPDGALYVADSGNHRIRRVDAAGVITTVAGTGQPGFSGDGGDALLARFDGPAALAFDAHGDLWVADTYNSRIRRIRFGE